MKQISFFKLLSVVSQDATHCQKFWVFALQKIVGISLLSPYRTNVENRVSS